MATMTVVPVEVYLRSSDYEPDAEYVDGVIEERPMGEFNHSDWQEAICAFFSQQRQGLEYPYSTGAARSGSPNQIPRSGRYRP